VTKVQLVGGKARQVTPGPPYTMIYGFVGCHLALKIIVVACTLFACLIYRHSYIHSISKRVFYQN